MKKATLAIGLLAAVTGAALAQEGAVPKGIPHLDHLRSFSVFGLSSIMLIFDDNSVNDWNRQKVLERLTQVNLPQGQNLQPPDQDGAYFPCMITATIQTTGGRRNPAACSANMPAPTHIAEKCIS